ncbi:MAG: phage virion morphogenesis protein [Candidatus Bipolaricaulota bacterium]|nr:phage virion morphogenesis protein [Candidatus Bipolaricaulota bacterium]
MAQGAIFEISIAGELQVRRLIEGVIHRGQDLRPVWACIARDFHEVETRQFATEGGLGRPWPPLSPAYAAWKAKHYPGAPILVRTGRLRASLVGSTRDTVEVMEPHMLRIGTRVPYALYHQTGTSRMPPRPPIVIPEAAKDRWVRLIHAYLKDGDLTAVAARTSLF